MNYNQRRYRQDKKLYRRWCEHYNDLKIPIGYREYLYDHLKLSQAQARVFHHFVWRCRAMDVKFLAAEFRGIAGIGVHDSIPDFLSDLKSHLERFRVRFRRFYFDLSQNKAHRYALHIDVDDQTYWDIEVLADWDEGESAHLSPDPVRLPKQKRIPPITTATGTQTAGVQPSHMQELIDYLHGRRVCYVLGRLARRSGTDLGEQNRIIYEAKLKTDRFYSDGSILNDKGIRTELFNGCHVIDISHAQLSIVATLWNLPKITSFLLSGADIWDELIGFSGLDKKDVKKFLYASIFGMDENGLAMIGPKLLEHDLMQELIAARNRQINHIQDGNPLTTAFGDVLSATGIEQARSILSTQVQSYEQALILHAFKQHIQHSKDAAMVGYLFDGFFLKFSHNANYSSKLINLIIESMIAKGKTFGMRIQCKPGVVVDEFADAKSKTRLVAPA